MKRLLAVLLTLALVCGCHQEKIIRVNIYTINSCGACRYCIEDLETYAKKHSEVYLTTFDLDEKKNMKRYQSLKNQYHLNNQTPVVEIAGRAAFSGYSKKTKKQIRQRISEIEEEEF